MDAMDHTRRCPPRRARTAASRTFSLMLIYDDTKAFTKRSDGPLAALLSLLLLHSFLYLYYCLRATLMDKYYSLLISVRLVSTT